MKLSTFIMENIEILLQDWDAFSQVALFDARRTRILRAHTKKILIAIASFLQQEKPVLTIIAEKQMLAHLAEGFSINDLAAEYRALRANVMKRWGMAHRMMHASDLNDIVRFNDAIDFFLNESIASYTASKEKQVHHFNTMLSVAYYDDLTGLPNRRLFRDRLNQAIKYARREKKLFALLSIDLDRFKDINDRLGHGAGDIVLQKAAGRISACVRETDTVARMGGDEFAVILANVGDPTQAKIVTEKILKALATFFQIEQQKVYVSGSVGITLCPLDGVDPEILLQNADKAMYVAKKLGRNRLGFYEDQVISNA